MQSSPNVRFAVRILASMGVFITTIGILMLIREPRKVDQWLLMFCGSLLCFIIIRQVKRGEGYWLDHIKLGKYRDKSISINKAGSNSSPNGQKENDQFPLR